MKLLGTRKVQAIVLAPTRELALQVTNEMSKLKHYENEFRIVTVYGGVNIEDQIRQLRQGLIMKKFLHILATKAQSPTKTNSK